MEIGTLLRARGQRLTQPRRLVWEVLTSTDRHLTAQQIADRVRKANPGVNVSSVYRSLALFAELDLIRESHLGGDGASRWEQTHPDDEFHLVCRRCGGVEHHAGKIVQRVRAHLGTEHGFEASGIELVATGTSASCAAAS